MTSAGTTRDFDAPTAAETQQRLDALDTGTMRLVRLAAHRHAELDDPVLAAAAVAYARRQWARTQWSLVAASAAGVSGGVMLGLLTHRTSVALLLGLAVPGVVAIRSALRFDELRRGEHHHLGVLREHGSVPPAAAGTTSKDGSEEAGRLGAHPSA